MKLTSLSLAAVLVFGGSAFAQTTTPAPGTDPAAPAMPAPDTSVTPATPGMPADKTGEPLSSGANSFTEEQARSWIEDAGYTDVSGLVQSDDGIWRGHARRNGTTVMVAVDYKGTVTTQ